MLRHEIAVLFGNIRAKFFQRPARDVALWLAAIPLLLPAHLIAAIIALSRRNDGDLDPRWNLVLAISIANFLLSIALLIWGYYLFSEWLFGHLHKLLGPLFPWPSNEGPLTVSAP